MVFAHKSLEPRETDVPVPDTATFLQLSLFAGLTKKPNLERFPGTLIVRRFRKGEEICRQGESGWTAFSILTTEDALPLVRAQLQAATDRGARKAMQQEVDALEERLRQLHGAPAEHPLRTAATVHLAFARPAPSGGQGLLSGLAGLLGGPRRTPDRRRLYIPIDAPTDVSYDSRQATLREGELFGERSSLYGTPRSATIVAERDCYMLEMLRNILDQVQDDKAYKARMEAVYKGRMLKDNLRNLSIFSDLTDEQFGPLSRSVDLVRFKDGQLICDEHEPSDSVYVICGGLVKVMKNVTSLLTAEDVLDWPALVAHLSDGPQATAGRRYLRGLLPERARAALPAAGSVPPATPGAAAPASTAARADLLAALNEIIKNPKLPAAAEMAEPAAPAVQDLRRGLPAKPDEWPELERRRYNRLLLEAALPGVLRGRQRPAGPETVLAYLARGDFIGEMGLLARQPRNATCVAYVHPRPEGGPAGPGERWRKEAERVELVRIPEAAFRGLLEATPAVRARVQQVVAARRKQSVERLRVPVWDDSKEVLLSGRAEKLGLIQGQKLMLIDLDRCTRCDECVQACVDTHADGHSRLFLDGPRFGKYLVPTSCRACLEPVCMIGCPVGSIHRGDNRQIVIENWCIGCGLCANSCPYGSIQMHDIGLIPEATHGWRYLPAARAGDGWFRPRHSTGRWLPGRTPFWWDRDFRAGLAAAGAGAEGAAVCFRYEFDLDREAFRAADQFRMELSSTDAEAAVWLNGQEVPRPAPDPKGPRRDRLTGAVKREHLIARDGGLLRAGANVVAVKAAPPADGKGLLLGLRLDEVRRPAVPPGLSDTAEITEKAVTELAVVCDQCSNQFGQRPACVTACPHDAAMRVDARFHFPET
jgi:Fe-S-cluster-containing hydrogenase component 2/CRP-like cAMP-binding protein